MRALAIVVTAVTVLSTSSFAVASPDPSTVRVDVGKDGNEGFGSGVVVRRRPPTVATCAHVIRDQREVYVYVPSLQSRVKATKVKAFFHHDLAFLLLDPDKLSQIGNVAEVDRAPVFHAPQEVPLDFDITGWGRYSNPQGGRGEIVGIPKELAQFGILGQLLRGGFGFSVLEVQGPKGTAIFEGGDSGAPLWVGGKVVALAAGLVKLSEQKRTFFAVPMADPVPELSEMADLPAKLNPSRDTDPYAGLSGSTTFGAKVVEHLVYRRDVRNALRASPGDGEKCADGVGDVFGRYVGRLNDAPADLPNGTPDCDRLYKVALARAVVQERNSTKSYWSARIEQSNPMAVVAPPAVVFRDPEAAVDAAARIRFGKNTEASKAIEALLEDKKGRAPAALPPKPAPTRAPPLSEQYAAIAKKAHDELEGILRSGQIPPALADAPPAPADLRPPREAPKDKPK